MADRGGDELNPADNELRSRLTAIGTMDTLEKRLLHALTTAQNDDVSAPQTEKRTRHIERDEAIRDAVDALTAAREALEFYGDEKNHKQTYIASRGFSVSEVICDNGRKANAALAKLKG